MKNMLLIYKTLSPLIQLNTQQSHSLLILDLGAQSGHLRVESAEVGARQLAVGGGLALQSVQLGATLLQLALRLLQPVQHGLLLLVGCEAAGGMYTTTQ